MTRADHTLDSLRQHIEFHRDMINATQGLKSLRLTLRYDEHGEQIEDVDLNIEPRKLKIKKSYPRLNGR